MAKRESANKSFQLSRICLERLRGNRPGMPGGSALILTVVLTSLLAIVGVVFLMISRIDRMATSGIADDKQLDFAVDAALSEIAGQLVYDVPGTRIPNSMVFPNGKIFPYGLVGPFPNGFWRPEYHDYPGPEDTWLASSEPNNAMLWSQISDVTGYLTASGQGTRNVQIAVIADDVWITLDPVTGKPFNQFADADGDGVSDSKWVVLEGVESAKGEPIYVAIRITDLGGMINANTAFKFDPGDPRVLDPCSPDWSLIDGTRLWHINLMGLASRPNVVPLPSQARANELALLLARANYGINITFDPCDIDFYEEQVSWRYGEPSLPYTPFDTSDELDLRNRFLLNQKRGRDTDVRIEHLGWAGSFLTTTTLQVPAGQGGGPTLGEWFVHAILSNDPAFTHFYDYRHIATTYNMDRVINPRGEKMLNINTTDAFTLRDAIEFALQDSGLAYPAWLSAQLAANIKDFRDIDPDVTGVPDSTGRWHFGHERPCIYISEVAGV
ncbi:MAG: hypothetical protein ACYS8Z_15250, partial [Planctomycetota bacterium]